MSYERLSLFHQIKSILFDCFHVMLYLNPVKAQLLEYNLTLDLMQEKNSISIYAFFPIHCMFTMYVCCISFVFIE